MGIGVPSPQNSYLPFATKITYGKGDNYLEVYGGAAMLIWYNSTSEYYGQLSDAQCNIIGGIMYRHEFPTGIIIRIGYTPRYDFGHSQYRHFYGASIGVALFEA
jgi:hypothetical protein